MQVVYVLRSLSSAVLLLSFFPSMVDLMLICIDTVLLLVRHALH
jgi:hypothetical protein